MTGSTSAAGSPGPGSRQYKPPLPGPGAAGFGGAPNASAASDTTRRVPGGNSGIGVVGVADGGNCGAAASAPTTGSRSPAQCSPLLTARAGCQISLSSRECGPAGAIAERAGDAGVISGATGSDAAAFAVGVGGDATSTAGPSGGNGAAGAGLGRAVAIDVIDVADGVVSGVGGAGGWAGAGVAASSRAGSAAGFSGGAGSVSEFGNATACGSGRIGAVATGRGADGTDASRAGSAAVGESDGATEGRSADGMVAMAVPRAGVPSPDGRLGSGAAMTAAD